MRTRPDIQQRAARESLAHLCTQKINHVMVQQQQDERLYRTFIRTRREIAWNQIENFWRNFGRGWW